MSTGAYLVALRRLIGPHGYCSHLISDQRVNPRIFYQDASDALGIRWHFISPPAAHFRGSWKRGLTSYSSHCRGTGSRLWIMADRADSNQGCSKFTSCKIPDLNDLNNLTLGYFWPLQQRNKWQSNCEPLPIGSLVVVKEEFDMEDGTCDGIIPMFRWCGSGGSRSICKGKTWSFFVKIMSLTYTLNHKTC